MSSALIISFPEQSEVFVLGFEAGMFYQRMDRSEHIEPYSVHTKNEECLRRIARHFGYDATFIDLGNEWSEITVERGRPKLSVVRP
jgi:hypothetical protein